MLVHYLQSAVIFQMREGMLRRRAWVQRLPEVCVLHRFEQQKEVAEVCISKNVRSYQDVQEAL